MKSLKGTKTHANLKDAFAGESQANRRYLYFAKIADVEGQPEIAGLFRDTAEGETGHAHGHLDYLKQVGDPATDQPIGDSMLNLKSAVHGETYEYTNMYPGDGEDRPRRGLHRDCRLVRDPGQGREVARRALPESHHDAVAADRVHGAPRARARRRLARRSGFRPAGRYLAPGGPALVVRIAAACLDRR